MKVGMIQSNFLPWRGYFDFIDDVDLFVFYDDVKYTHRSWRNRNLIKTANGPIWLSVPVLHGQDTLIQDAEIDYSSRWVDKHIRTLSLAYQKAQFYKTYSDELFQILTRRAETISVLNVAICKWVMEQLSITTETKMSSAFDISGDKFERPLAIVKHVGATSYLSGPTARDYTDIEFFKMAGIGLEFKAYEYPEYRQLFGPYISNVSVVDLLFNCGESSRSFLKSVRPNEVVVAERPHSLATIESNR